MLTDAHCHIADLAEFGGVAGFSMPIAAVTSAWNQKDFDFNKNFAKNMANSSLIMQSFGAHPQLPLVNPKEVQSSLETLRDLLDKNELSAIGETGFDLFNADFRQTEAAQDALFAEHTELASEHALPFVLHIRKAMHKVFAYTPALKKVSAVIFHSYSGTADDGLNLLKRGVNAYFSFGAAILLNHKTARAACRSLPLDRLLAETDAPYQPFRGEKYSHWGNLPAIITEIFHLREEKIESFEQKTALIEENFREAFLVKENLTPEKP